MKISNDLQEKMLEIWGEEERRRLGERRGDLKPGEAFVDIVDERGKATSSTIRPVRKVHTQWGMELVCAAESAWNGYVAEFSIVGEGKDGRMSRLLVPGSVDNGMIVVVVSKKAMEKCPINLEEAEVLQVAIRPAAESANEWHRAPDESGVPSAKPAVQRGYVQPIESRALAAGSADRNTGGGAQYKVGDLTVAYLDNPPLLIFTSNAALENRIFRFAYQQEEHGTEMTALAILRPLGKYSEAQVNLAVCYSFNINPRPAPVSTVTPEEARRSVKLASGADRTDANLNAWRQFFNDNEAELSPNVSDALQVALHEEESKRKRGPSGTSVGDHNR